MTKLAKVGVEAGAVLTRVQQQRLVKDVRGLLEAGRVEAQQAVDRVALSTYWQVGQRVLREALSERAGYGTALLAEVAREVGVEPRTLQQAVQLARLYEEAPSGALNWSQYRELMRIKDDAERAYYEALAEEHKWSKRELVEAIREDAFALSLTSDTKPNKPSAKTLPRPSEPDYLYTVEPLRVIDGDTIDVQVDLGFEVLRRYRLRLAAVNTPEKKTPGAAEAARYVVERLAASTLVVVQTVRVDLHGRYVAHVFYSTQQTDSLSKAAVYASGHYLNHELVQRGLAKVAATGK